MVVCVSSATCCTRWVRKVAEYTASAAANPAAASPTSRWISAQTLPAPVGYGGASRRRDRRIGCSSGAPGAIAEAGSVTAGRTS